MAWLIMLVAKTAATPNAMAMPVRQVRSRRDARFRQARLYTERIERMVLQSPFISSSAGRVHLDSS
jgi:hypothetical protein